MVQLVQLLFVQQFEQLDQGCSLGRLLRDSTEYLFSGLRVHRAFSDLGTIASLSFEHQGFPIDSVLGVYAKSNFTVPRRVQVVFDYIIHKLGRIGHLVARIAEVASHLEQLGALWNGLSEELILNDVHSGHHVKNLQVFFRDCH